MLVVKHYLFNFKFLAIFSRNIQKPRLELKIYFFPASLFTFLSPAVHALIVFLLQELVGLFTVDVLGLVGNKSYAMFSPVFFDRLWLMGPLLMLNNDLPFITRSPFILHFNIIEHMCYSINCGKITPSCTPSNTPENNAWLLIGKYFHH